MLFKYKPTKIKTIGRLPQASKRRVKLPRKTNRLTSSHFAYQSLVRA